jgi:hypothetical protein
MQNDSPLTDRNLLLIQKKYEACAEHRLRLQALRKHLSDPIKLSSSGNNMIELSDAEIALLLILVNYELEFR